MPRQTFFNLALEKQGRIIAAATREFAEHGYRGSSVQAIATKAGVAKGSVYQYFSNKEDLFFYLVDLATGKQIDFLARSVQDQGSQSLFDTLEALFSAGFRFAQDNPDLLNLYRALRQGAPRRIQEYIDRRVTALWNQHYQNLLAAAVEEGVVRQDLRLDLAAFVVYTLVTRSSELLVSKEALSEAQKEAYLEQGLELIRRGLRA